MNGGNAPPDPFLLYDTSFTPSTYGWRVTAGLTLRSPTINTSLKTLVLLVGGQSLSANVTPTLYTPTNSSVVDQFNIYDGGVYSIGGALLGSTFNPTLTLGPGNIAARIADTLVTNAKFDRVIICCTSIGSTTASDWGDTTGIHYSRMPVMMRRLASRGITPGMTGVTFACLFDLGEQDLSNGTSQAAMTASLNGFISNLQATGFNGRIFIPLESGLSQTSNNVRSAQAAVITGNVKAGGDFDAIGNRADGIHWNDTGAASAAAAVITAMGSSGAPF